MSFTLHAIIAGGQLRSMVMCRDGEDITKILTTYTPEQAYAVQLTEEKVDELAEGNSGR